MDNQNPQANPKKLFVGNLSYQTQEQSLVDLFSPFGEIVEVKLITDRFTGRSKGIAFVEFQTEESAQAAINELNNKEFDGRTIFVSVARPQEKRENRSFGGDRGGFGGGNRRGGGGFGGGNRRGGGDRY